MASKSRQSLLRKSKEQNLDYDELASSDDEIAFQYFFHDQIEKDIFEDTVESESKARLKWNNMNIFTKKSYYKSTKDHAIILNHDNSKRSPSPTVKRSKKDSFSNIENNVNSKSDNDNEQLFHMEIQRLVASPAQYLYQPVCSICETFIENINTIQCNGICKRHFHLSCMNKTLQNLNSSNIIFQCIDCQSNKYRCIICGNDDDLNTLLDCENSDCGRLYHETCLKNENFIGLEIIDGHIKSCPSHYCSSCVREDASHAQNPCKKLIECFRCPLSFHCNDFCMAAGAFELSLSHVVCPRHYQSNLIKKSTFKPFHPAWCFKCFKSGSKIQCMYCPTTYHLECIDNYQCLNEEYIKKFICNNCRNYRQPRYGEITFVKVSQYRWWPCEIIHPRNAPMNILKLKRPDGTFPVLFLGSNEYQWVAKTRSIDYNTAHQSSIFKDLGGTSKMNKEFTLGVKSAIKIHQIFVNIVKNYVPLKSIWAPVMSEEDLYRYMNVKENHKTIKFKPIKANILVPPAKLPPKMPTSICDCIESCQLMQCKNYLKKIECQTTCHTQNLCQNQQFTNYVNKNLAIFKTTNRGFGFKTMVSIKKNDFIIEYLGDMISKSESTIRFQNSKKCNTKDFYMIRLTSDLIIDAGPKGNLSRYINHSCDPNCYLEKWIVNGYPRLGVFALNDIEAEQELTFDYRISGVIMKEDAFCLCGSLNCTGFLGPIKSCPNSPIKTLANSKYLTTNLITTTTPLTVEIKEKLTIINSKYEEPTQMDEDKQLQLEQSICDNNNIIEEQGKDLVNNIHDEIVSITRSDSEESKTIHENACYRCFDGGELILCDKTDCPKTYHISCLGLQVAPVGTWFCPWHFCDMCGQPSQIFCVQCPSSFCDRHTQNICPPNKGSRKSICMSHKDTEHLHNKINIHKLKLENISPNDHQLFTKL